MRKRTNDAFDCFIFLATLLISQNVFAFRAEAIQEVSPLSIQGQVVDCKQVDDAFLETLATTENLVLVLDGENDALQTQVAAEMFESRGRIDYFIEVGRNEKLADEHPEWICSLQGHPEWRHKFPEVGGAGDDELVKCYPWVSVFYESAFQAHLERIKKLLANKPKPTRIWLNDLQAGPSACGCGHILCRWTTDYGPVATADKLGDDAIALFVAEVKTRCTRLRSHSNSDHGMRRGRQECECGGVDCFFKESAGGRFRNNWISWHRTRSVI
ncbi:MAG: hypothetical protein R3C03_03985 [Pirellulaceae bacterium]